MGVYSVPVTIGVDEERITKEIESNVERRVVETITNDVKKVMFEKRNYYATDLTDPEPTRKMVREEIAKIVDEKQDLIVQLAAELLADKMARMKAVKEVAKTTAEKVCE